MEKIGVRRRLSTVGLVFVMMCWCHDTISIESIFTDFAPVERGVSHQSTEPNPEYKIYQAAENMKHSIDNDQHYDVRAENFNNRVTSDYNLVTSMRQPIAQEHAIDFRIQSPQRSTIDFNHVHNDGISLDFSNMQLPKEPLLASDARKLIISEFAKLPESARPKNIAVTLARMDKGEMIENAILGGDSDQITRLVTQTSLPKKLQETLVSLLVGKDAQGNIIAADTMGVNLLKNNPIQCKQLRDAYLTMLVDMQWGLFKKAMVRQEGFASGAITVIDPHGSIMKSMENYVKFVNPKFNAPGLSLSSITNGEAYSRSGSASGHWKGQVVDDRIYGINVKFNGKYTQSLPQNKDQLHFAQLTNDRVFIKWEYYGTTFNVLDTTAINHVVNYIKDNSGITKLAQRTEAKIPKDVTKKFNNLIKKAKIKLHTQQVNMVQQQGISGMRKILLNSNDPSLLINFDTFLTKIKKYDQETLLYRKADEVILKGE
ncbi:MAG: hypothetical protein Q8Q60_03370 [Candidatus Chromulinivorax sp.]|nr:hypothetical protein [Candidatus Chromulinivorax sp.]